MSKIDTKCAFVVLMFDAANKLFHAVAATATILDINWNSGSVAKDSVAVEFRGKKFNVNAIVCQDKSGKQVSALVPINVLTAAASGNTGSDKKTSAPVKINPADLL